MQGGGNRQWLAPLDQTGNQTGYDSVDGAHIVGQHKGFYAGLNVANPRPGFSYQWIRSDPREVFLARQRGWQVVNTTDEDGPAFTHGLYQDDDSDTPTPLDTTGVFQDVVMVRISEGNLRKIEDEHKRLNEIQMSGGTEEFLQGASGAERATGHTQRGYMPTRLARTDHSTTVREGDEVKATIPMGGIVKE
jgi:hypothetical protein